jgi:hypothetical protein
MEHLRLLEKADQPNTEEVEKYIEECQATFTGIISEILRSKNEEIHHVESSIFRRLLSLGLMLLHLYFSNQNQGDYGEELQTSKGMAKRGKHPSKRVYFSIFGQLDVTRYRYEVNGETFAPLDVVLNFPRRCYSYFLSEIVNLLSIRGAYDEGLKFLQKIFNLNFSVSAMETIARESWGEYENFYELKKEIAPTNHQAEFTVVSFDGKGVPMIKKEAASLKGKEKGGKGKKKEALVGVTYQINANIRSPEEVAQHLVFPNESENQPSASREKAQDIRYIASIEQPKKDVMTEIKQEIIMGQYSQRHPLICIMDGALSLWNSFRTVFKEVKNKVLILDIIHALEYIGIIANAKFQKGSKEARDYVYEKLLLLLKGKVASYILELQNELVEGELTSCQKKEFSKVITYYKNHKQYMKYHQYLEKGYPIGSGVVESACGHLVKDRTEISGARWGIQGAEAILKLRAVVKSKDWDSYWAFFIKQKHNHDFLPGNDSSLNLQHKMMA